MVGFLFNQFFGIRDGGPYVFNRDLVLSAYLVKGHSVRQSAEDAGHWYARAEDHWFPVLDLRINENSFIHGLVYRL